MASEARWEGSRGFMPAVRMARAISELPPELATAEELLVGRSMAGMLTQARVVNCPAEQLNAVSDDVFEDLGRAFEYAAEARLPFAVTFFDFLDALGHGPAIGVHFVEGGGKELGFQLQGVVAAESEDERETIYLPILGAPGQAPEEIGAAFVGWDGERQALVEPHRWQEPSSDSGVGPVTLFSVSAAMDALGETPRAVGGALVGVARGDLADEAVDEFRMFAAAMTGTAMRQALKVVYLLDSMNVELTPATVSRQVRRQAQRQGTQIAWTVHVRQAVGAKVGQEDSGSRGFSHRFEVRGNFAHHPAGSWLYRHSARDEIHPCPRCGVCRRVWRPPHIKGPADRPLAIKIRRVDFNDRPT